MSYFRLSYLRTIRDDNGRIKMMIKIFIEPCNSTEYVYKSIPIIVVYIITHRYYAIERETTSIKD